MTKDEVISYILAIPPAEGRRGLIKAQALLVEMNNEVTKFKPENEKADVTRFKPEHEEKTKPGKIKKYEK